MVWRMVFVSPVAMSAQGARPAPWVCGEGRRQGGIVTESRPRREAGGLAQLFAGDASPEHLPDLMRNLPSSGPEALMPRKEDLENGV